jgi:hypothetical protein
MSGFTSAGGDSEAPVAPPDAPSNLRVAFAHFLRLLDSKADRRTIKEFVSNTGICVAHHSFEHSDLADLDASVDDDDFESIEHNTLNFLSYYALKGSDWEKLEEFERAPRVIQAYLTFLASLPFVSGNAQRREIIAGALGIATRAVTELPACFTLQSILPGPVSRLASGYAKKNIGKVEGFTPPQTSPFGGIPSFMEDSMSRIFNPYESELRRLYGHTELIGRTDCKVNARWRIVAVDVTSQRVHMRPWDRVRSQVSRCTNRAD